MLNTCINVLSYIENTVQIILGLSLITKKNMFFCHLQTKIAVQHYEIWNSVPHICSIILNETHVGHIALWSALRQN